MKIIEKFTFSKFNLISKLMEYQGESTIRKEIETPIIKFVDNEGNIVNIENYSYPTSISPKQSYDGIIYSNNHYNILKFNSMEVDFLTNNYNLKYVDTDLYTGFLPNTSNYLCDEDLLVDNEVYLIFELLVDLTGREYLILTFERYSKNYSRRMRDQNSPNLHYIHGIWEDPLLTDDIIYKIKGI